MRVAKSHLLILRLLQRKPNQYAAEMVAVSDGQLSHGSIYVQLRRMEREGYLASKKEDPVDGQVGLPRRLYWITGYGAQVLRACDAKADAAIAGELAPNG